MSQPKRSSKDKYLDSLKKRYARASKKERGQMLDEYVQTTGYHRKHAIAILSGRYQPGQRPFRRPRKTIYAAEDATALAFLSDLFDGINAKLLRAALDVELTPLYQRGVLQVSRACYRRLQHISPEDYPRILRKFQEALKPGGMLYFTMDRADLGELEEAYKRVRAKGLPVVLGELVDEVDVAYAQVKVSDQPVPGALADAAVYHFYPSLDQAREWIDQAGLAHASRIPLCPLRCAPSRPAPGLSGCFPSVSLINLSSVT